MYIVLLPQETVLCFYHSLWNASQRNILTRWKFNFTTQDCTQRALLTTRTPVSSKIFGLASIRVRVTTFFLQGSGFHLFKSQKNVKSPRVWQQSRNSRRISPGLGSKVQIIIFCFWSLWQVRFPNYTPKGQETWLVDDQQPGWRFWVVTCGSVTNLVKDETCSRGCVHNQPPSSTFKLFNAFARKFENIFFIVFFSPFILLIRSIA